MIYYQIMKIIHFSVIETYLLQGKDLYIDVGYTIILDIL